MSEYFPPAAFYFSVEIPESGGGADGVFQEVSGIEVEHETETISIGGLNEYSYKVPKKAKYPNLVLKRGLVTGGSSLADWAMDHMGKLNKKIKPLSLIYVHLEDETGEAIKTWAFHNVWPVKWSMGGMNAQENKIAIETIELAYTYFEIRL
jgi:phage tail-like protein